MQFFDTVFNVKIILWKYPNLRYGVYLIDVCLYVEFRRSLVYLWVLQGEFNVHSSIAEIISVHKT